MIQTFKSHFISILAGVDDKFPLSLWCHLLEPAELTLNLLRQTQITPNVSAFVHVHGNHDYMRKPFAPIGSKIQTHMKQDDRLSWDTRSEPGFNLGTLMEHNCCFRVCKAGAMIYDDYTTKITTSNPPVLDADRCDSTGLWKLPLDDKIKETSTISAMNKAINAIFDLPSALQTFLWYHASAGFPVKEQFI